MKIARAIVLLFAICALPAHAETIRVGLAMPKDMPEVFYVNGMFEHFKENVEAQSNGTLKVQIYYGGVLGKPDERLNQMRRNVIQMSDAADGNYATIHRDIQVFSIPYLFPSTEIARRVLDGPVGSRVAEDIRLKTGIRVLGWWEAAGFKHYSANSPITEMADFRGKKIRVMSAVFSIPVNAMGGTAIPIPMNELYISLKTGVVDGQDNAVAVFNMQKLHEVQKYITLDGHAYGFGPMGINDAFFSSLSEAHQRIVLDAGAKAVAWNRVMSRRFEEDAIAFAKSKNVHFITLSEDRRQRIAEMAQPAVMDWLRANIDTPALIDAVVAETKRLAELVN
jgi:tripartite ATP-independent transporter DctP family solute receptor